MSTFGSSSGSPRPGEPRDQDAPGTAAPPRDERDRTIRDFGEQWTAYPENTGAYADRETLADIFGPLLSLDEVRGRRVAEIGSGSGRIVNMLLDSGVAHVTALEPSAAMEACRRNTAGRSDRVRYVNAPGEELPADGFDYVLSIGVLHHIPDPRPVVDAAFAALKPGGRCLVWLYGREGNETYLRVATPLRALTTRMPHPMLGALCHLLALPLDLYILLCRYLPLPMRAYMNGVLAKWDRPTRRLTIYDQLNPATARYYRREEAEALLAGAGFAQVRLHHRHGYSWTAIGTRPA